MEMLNMAWNVVPTRHSGAPLWRHWIAGVPALLPALVVAIALLSLLMAFQLVVREAVQTGESRRLAVAAHADASWRCGILNGRNLRESCALALNSPNAGVSTSVYVP